MMVDVEGSLGNHSWGCERCDELPPHGVEVVESRRHKTVVGILRRKTVVEGSFVVGDNHRRRKSRRKWVAEDKVGGGNHRNLHRYGRVGGGDDHMGIPFF